MSTLQGQVEALLQRKIVENRVAGAQNSDVEARALFESIALSLLLKPKSVLYVALLARNGLLQTVRRELALAEALKRTIQSLGNPSVSLTDPKHLTRARQALVQLEGLDKVDVAGNTFNRFSRAVDDFLTKTVGKGVRQGGQLARSFEEARTDLATDLASLKSAHEETLDRLYALAVGVENFISSPVSTVLGVSAVYRVRKDLETLIAEVQEGSARATDAVTRLIASRASLKAVGNLPDLYAPLVSTGLPVGHALRAATPALPVVVETEWQGPPGGGYELQVNGLPSVLFPQTTFDLAYKNHLVSDLLSDWVFIPATGALFLSLEAEGNAQTVKIALTPGYRTFGEVVTELDTQLAAVANGGAAEFCMEGTRRLLLWSDTYTLTFVPSMLESTVGSTVGDVFVNAESIHEYLALPLYRTGGEVTPQTVSEAFNILFGSEALCEVVGTSLRLTSVSTEPGTSLSINPESGHAIGWEGTHVALTDQVYFYGQVYGREVDPVDPGTLMDVGDVVRVPFLPPDEDPPAELMGVTLAPPEPPTPRAKALSLTGITLSFAVPTFDAPVTVVSALDEAYRPLEMYLKMFLDRWLTGPWAEGLRRLDALVATLGASPTPAQRNATLHVLDHLLGELYSLRDLLGAPDTLLPTGAATEERRVVDGVVNSLSERKYDRAVDYLFKCKIQEMLSLTGETASFGGAFLQAMSDFAQNNVKFPDTSKDEGGEATNGQETGL